jgi:hypothetical protein
MARSETSLPQCIALCGDRAKVSAHPALLLRVLCTGSRELETSPLLLALFRLMVSALSRTGSGFDKEFSASSRVDMLDLHIKVTARLEEPRAHRRQKLQGGHCIEGFQ